MNDIVRRTPQFVLSIAVCFLTLWFFNFSDFLLFKLLATIMIVVACNELCNMFHLTKSVAYTIMLVSIATPGWFALSQYTQILTVPLNRFSNLTSISYCFIVGITFIILFHRKDSKKNAYVVLFKSIFVLSLSIVYLTVPLHLLFGVSHLDNALIIYLIPILTVAILDTVSYLCGKLFGKRSKRIFYLSPNKTAIGTLYGVTLTLIVVYIVMIKLYPPHNLFDVKMLLLVVIMIWGGIIGDLFGSLLKRIADVKDSGTLIRGRGGAIDSIDSLLFVIILFWSFGPLLIPELWR